MRRQLKKSLGSTPLSRVESIAERVERLGGQLWIVGGAVRDALLGRESTDVDLAINIDLPPLLDSLRTPFGELRLRRHDRFGTATLEWPGSPSFDLVQCRGERYERPAALPTIWPADLAEDLARRDFTIHAMAVEIRPGKPFKLIDPHGGRTDLEHRIIKALHAESFRDDPTRAYRATRYAARLQFRIDRTTTKWMQAARHDELGQLLSPHRRTDELRHILAEATAPVAWKLLRRHRLLGWAPPAAEAKGSAVERGGWIKRWEQSCTTAGEAPDSMPSFEVAISLFALELGQKGRERIASMLELTRGERELLIAGVRQARGALTKIERSQRRSSVDLTLGALSKSELELALIAAPAATARSILRWIGHDRLVRLEIDGRALLDAAIPPGPAVARGLRAARRARLDRGVRDRDGQLRVALRSARSS